MPTSAQVPENHPLMIAWKAYVETDEYQNSFNWAEKEEHRKGSMWAAFDAGFRAASSETEIARLKAQIAELRDGIAPFAAVGLELQTEQECCIADDDTFGEGEIKASDWLGDLSVGSFRNARAILAKIDTEQETG